jgi:LPS export ABC transporter protein LptC
MKWSVGFAFLGVIFLLSLFTEIDSDVTATHSSDQLVEVEIDELVITRYDDSGQRLETSEANHAVRFEGETKTQLSQLDVSRVDKYGHRWTMSAPRGFSEIVDNNLLLDGGVMIQRDGDLTLKTDSILVDTVAQIASSSDRTRLSSERADTVASGFHLNLNEGTAELVGQVSSIYQGSQ